MAVQLFTGRMQTTYIGLSTDTKPTNTLGTPLFAGDLFIETDTANQYTWSGSAWILWSDFAGEDVTFTLTAQGTGTVNFTDQINGARFGMNVLVNITAITAGTLTVNVQGKDVASGTYYTMLASAALAATGATRLQLFPGATVTANVSANTSLPKTWRIQAVVATGPVTATIGASLV